MRPLPEPLEPDEYDDTDALPPEVRELPLSEIYREDLTPEYWAEDEYPFVD